MSVTVARAATAVTKGRTDGHVEALLRRRWVASAADWTVAFAVLRAAGPHATIARVAGVTFERWDVFDAPGASAD